MEVERMSVLERLSSRREGAVVIDSFYEAGVVESYPEVFEVSQAEEPSRLPIESFSRALEAATLDDSSELPDLRIDDAGIGV
jgi:hypothetical protein